MPRTVPADHFSTGSWAARGPLGFAHLTCVACGHRSASDWAAFRDHRRRCPGHQRGRPDGPPDGRGPADEEPLERIPERMLRQPAIA